MNAAGIDVPASGPSLPSQLAKLVNPWRRSLLAIALLVLAAALFELAPPILLRSIIDHHLAVGRTQGLLLLAVLYLGATALGQGMTLAYGYLAAAVAQHVLSGLRVRLFAHLQRLPTSYFDCTPLGDVISRCTADVETLDTVFTTGVATLVANLFPARHHRGGNGHPQPGLVACRGPGRSAFGCNHALLPDTDSRS